jgi:tRNA 2-selenouridine synthase
VSIKRLSAKDFLTVSAGAIVIDVRSPAEFSHAHMPGAVSIPLFTDEERKVVGTAYKQESREKAIKHGLDFFGPKMRPIVEQVENLIAEREQTTEQPEASSQKLKAVFLYCWRGGMRSGAIAWLLDLYGFEVTVLAGGYKAYRNLVLKTFEYPYSFKVLGGFTGSGKTELIHELKRSGERIIDLEGIAKHKGSAFGNIDMPPQPGQEMFENLLAGELLQMAETLDARESSTVNREKFENQEILTAHDSRLTTESGSTIWIEDESQRIGLLNLPHALWKTIRESPVFFLDIPFESRLDHITEEYGKLNRERLADAITRISKRLGPQDTKASLEFLGEGNIKECFRILLKYYDKHYLKALYNREAINRLLTKIPSENVTAGNVNLLTPILHE